MTVQLDWPPDVVDRLTEEARRNGLSLDAYVLQTVLHQESANGASAIDEPERHRKRKKAAANIRELRKGITLGPDLTIRDLINEGRQTLDAYLLQEVLQQKCSTGTKADDAEERRKRAEAGARLLELQKHVKPDPEGWTSRDYINYGRR